jgi:oligopeptide transport system substrate-binding protein
MTRHPSLTIALALLMLTGCGRNSDDSPLAVSVIGGPVTLADPNEAVLSAPEAVLTGATAQGLVRYDATGQIEAGLAIRWAISEDGLYYTFRLADMEGVDADFVARRLRAVIGKRSRNALKPILGAIDEIVAVTPAVVEIRLKAARPNLLDLLAQPEMAIVDKKIVTGPLTVASREGQVHTLQPLPTDDEEDAPDAAELRRRQLMLRSDRPALAVARFQAGETDLVLGGRFADLGIVQAANVRARDLRMDPVSGLFGFMIAERHGFVGDSENRRALAMAIDRDRIAAAFGVPGWQPSVSLVTSGTTELPQPVQPGWGDRDLAARHKAASDTVRFWKQANPDTSAEVRVALPDGPGSRLLFALLRSDWAAIGVNAVRVGMNGDADLRLIDEVAPANTATWYLRHFNCDRSPVCSEAADAALEIARSTPDPVDRAARIADADLRLAEIVPYIPIAQPLRWSLVAPRVTGFVSNNRGVHPLNHLIDETR